MFVTRQGTVPLVQRERGGQIRWATPSGLIENGVMFEDAALREAYEKTNEIVTVDELLCVALIEEPATNYK